MHVLPHKANVKPGKKTNRKTGMAITNLKILTDFIQLYSPGTNVDIWANVLYIGDITQDMVLCQSSPGVNLLVSSVFFFL